MISQPLQEGEVFLSGMTAKVELVNSVPIHLIWKRRFELLSELVRPADVDVGQLEHHLWLQGTPGMQEGMGNLRTGEVRAVEAFGGGGFMHFSNVQRNVLK